MKEPVESVKERPRSPGLRGSTKVSEEKENVEIGGFGEEKGNANLGMREVKEKKVGEKEKDDFEKENGERDRLVKLKIGKSVGNEKKRKKLKNCKENVGNEKERKMLKICKENVGNEKLDAGECCGSGDWTKEEDALLQRAYFVAKPSPHFWKKVARLVLFSNSFRFFSFGAL